MRCCSSTPHQTPLCAERFAAGVRGGRTAGGPASSISYRRMTTTAKLIAHDGVDYVAFTGSVAGGHAVRAGGAGPLHRRRPRARRQGPGLCARRRQPRPRGREPGRRRLLQLRPVLLRHRAHLRAREALRRVRRRRGRADAQIRARQSDSSRTPRSARWCAPRPPTSCAARSRKPSRPARERADRRKQFRGEQAGHALSRAADPGRTSITPCGS